MAQCKTVAGTLVGSVFGAVKLKPTAAMKKGLRLEPLVKKEVEKSTGIQFRECGLLLQPDLPIFGASPDGISDKYVLEIKSPLSDRALPNYFTKDRNQPSKKYLAQIQMQMHMSGRKRGYYCVASPDFEKNQRGNHFAREL